MVQLFTQSNTAVRECGGKGTRAKFATGYCTFFLLELRLTHPPHALKTTERPIKDQAQAQEKRMRKSQTKEEKPLLRGTRALIS